MDRQKTTRAVCDSPVQTPRCSPFQLLLHTSADQRIRAVADATRRRTLYDLAILWLKKDRPRTEEGGEQCQSQACATNHAPSWSGEQSARAKYLEAASGAHQVSVFAERAALIEPPRGLEYGYNLYSASSGVRVSRSCD